MAIDRSADCIEIARQVFQEVAATFPALRSSIQVDPHAEVALTLDFDEQSGLLFPVRATLQNLDELHLHAGAVFWYEWFPCYYPDRAAAFREAIVGVLSGEYRIVEFYRKDRPIKADLQRIENGVWKRMAYTTNLRLPSFRRSRTRILQNARTTA